MNKGIEITEKNFNDVAARIYKFIGTGDEGKKFKIWHQWTGGMKKRLGTTMIIKKLLEDTTEVVNVVYPMNYAVMCVEPLIKQIVISWYDDFDDYCELSLSIGDRVRFLGNRVIFRIPSIHPKYKYLYQCIQIDK